ncbi:MAG: PH domain-containing protein [Promethearchaeota archaeon]
MSGKVSEKVIKPPLEDIASGKIFVPDVRFKYKMWLGIFLGPLAMYVFAMVCWLGTAYLIFVFDEGTSFIGFMIYLTDWFWPVTFWWWVVFLCIWIVPGFILVPLYIRSFRYSVISKKGDAMPEIFTRKGLFNITERHVPFRTITNISSRAGVIDRLLGIGSVEIETAGFTVRGTGQPGPEEKIEGIVFYEELRDYILHELRKFRAPYVTGTEVVHPEEEPVPVLEGTLNDEILLTLRQIRDSMAPLHEILRIIKEREEEK